MKFIDKEIRKSLDLDYILNKVRVNTPYGKTNKDALKAFLPGEEKSLRKELDKVEAFASLISRERSFFINLRNLFVHVKDLRHSISRCIEGYILTEVELFEIKNLIILFREIKDEIEKINFSIPKDMKVESMIELEELLDPREEGLKTFYIYDEYSQNLKDIRKEKKDIEKRIAFEKKVIRMELQHELGIKIRHNGEVSVPKSDIEIINRIEKHPLLMYSSETYMDLKYKFKSTDMLDYLERQLEDYKQREENEEFKIRSELSKEIAEESRRIFNNMEAIGRLDLTIAKAYLAIDIGGVKPNITTEHIIIINDGRHLRVEEALMQKRKEFTPITVSLNQGVTCITGANMGGKTVSLKLIGMLCAMAQYGLFVPCSKMEMGLHGFIHISIGDWQSSDQGLSTFGSEVEGIQRAIDRVKEKGLILIDELARGTNPQEGHAISKAIVNYLKDKESISVITTHYDNVANSEGVMHLQVIGLANVDYKKLKEELKYNKNYGIDLVTQYMDYRLRVLRCNSEVPRDAINVARLMGLHKDIVAMAEGELEES
ncbi:MutS-related protein [Sporosalibacterium faouarense]|uniref:lysine 5,6-aminomutase reactivase ATPase KamC n=1 Tax=Sporosalibacterium faouarense TaxID=516123 RepID=UPI00192CB1D0|nr:DNA mismatch repair protein MutS [Sporosalibacterium faouarense]